MDVEELALKFGWVDYFLGEVKNSYADEHQEDDSEKFLVDQNSDVDII